LVAFGDQLVHQTILEPSPRHLLSICFFTY
jgi:hypothetical protein